MEILKKTLEKIKGYMTGNRKKLVENTLIVLIIGIMVVIAGGTLFKGGSKAKEVNASNDATASVPVVKDISQADRNDEVKEMEEILSKIDGAGRVSVMITYASGKEMVTASDRKETENNSDEKDSNGGTRSVRQSDSESTTIYEEGQGGVKKPFVLKELHPQVKGVIVVADGASDPVVRESLSKAVQVLMDVPIHKVQVFERKK